MNWKQLLSNKRFGLENLHEARKEDRTEFQRDYDRLIFSAPFRRLQNKTQVFPLPGSIFVHNRLTHSLEVSCVGRSLGNKIASELLKLHPELHDTHISEIGSIVSAACLAHDLGNPPFGHSGEKKFGFFTSEEEAFQKIAHELGLKKISKEGEPLKYCRHPLVYLVEAADDICYQMMDIEDAHKLKILTTQETKELYLRFFAPEKLDHIQSICKMVDDTNEQIAYLRSSAIGVLISECVRTFILHEEEILKGEFQGTLIQKLSSRVREAYENCSHTAFEKIYCSKDVVDIELAGYQVITTLVDLMIEAVRYPEKAYSQLLINRVSSQYHIQAPTLYEKIQAVLDYISGMTDVYALDLYRKINGNSLPAL